MNRLNTKYRQILLLVITIFSSGCASSPLFQEWDWSIRPDWKQVNADAEIKRKTHNSKMQEIYAKYPEWRNATVDENELFVESHDIQSVEFYDINGRKTGSARVK